ncbi:MAG: hypothetical protein ACD_64C00019G0001 [uncultured bacterium]|nr:MAG: hypothetical protein ACD_64C00019G0001 [uncultured bacterium]HLE76726.1 hypothetical protein [Candidatus Babeliales bacterium]
MIMARMILTRLALIGSFLAIQCPIHALSSLAKNDPYPVFSSLDPHTFLYTHEKLKVSDPDFAARKRDTVGISISPFGQNADRGRNGKGHRTELGNLNGNWGMIPLLYGPIPPGKTLAPTLQTALANLFPGVTPGSLNDGTKIDPSQQFGYFSVPLEYRKRGVRFQMQADIYAGFGLSLETGLVSMSQTNTGFIDLTGCENPTCPFEPAPLTHTTVRKYLMSELKPIAKEIGLNICNYCETSVEEVRFQLFWRRGFEINRDDEDWPHFMIIPFFEVGATASPGNEARLDDAGFDRAFYVPFGNNDHMGVGFTTGLNIDFVESIEVGAEVGMTYFFDRNFEKVRVPTSEFQSGIYPFTTDINVHPGFNWHFGGKISAFHFIDRLSSFLQYIQMEHKPDTIRLRNCEDADYFLPEQLEKLTGFKAKFIDVALNYDISPNIGLGLFWQAPISQLNSYRSSTVMFSFYATF